MHNHMMTRLRLRRRALFACSWLTATTGPLGDSAFLASAFIAPHGRSMPTLSNSNNGASFLPPLLPSPPPAGRRSRHVVASSDVVNRGMATIPTEASSSPSSAAAVASGGRKQNYSKLRQLKDRMWVREALEDITAAEFASSLSVEAEVADTSGSTDRESTKIWGKKSKSKRAVDFDNILDKLDVRIEEMCVLSSPEVAAEMNQTCHIMSRRVPSGEDGEGEATFEMENTCYSLAEDMGMGSVVYTPEQREALLKQLIGTREKLVSFIQGSGKSEGEEEDDIDEIREQLLKKSNEGEEGTAEPNGKKDTSSSKTTFDPSLYVREDGTVDWDGALQDREALKKFGGAVWSRINGQEPEADGDEARKGDDRPDEFQAHTKAVTAKIEETEAIRAKRDQRDVLMGELQKLEEDHTRLLNSALSAGQAVANVNLATVDASLRQRIRESSEALETKQSRVTFGTLDYELERIYTYLEGELGNTAAKGYIPLQDRLNVAEFGLLESQIENFHRRIELGEELDGDVLAVVADQLVDFKRRLGIDYYVAGLTFDMEAIQVWSRDIWAKTKTGFAFYVKGTRLFWDDVVFCSSLILRALQGYTLKPREVRTLRRTFKDTITFIPVVIILLIPLSPIGHVLVFGAIQRVFPDFFPSCFTERRQNLLELYESTEYSAVTINETWTQQFVRMSQATRILALRLVTELYTSLGGVLAEKSDDNGDNKGQP